jgi:carbon monoxide dehydrogenase subunit G
MALVLILAALPARASEVAMVVGDHAGHYMVEGEFHTSAPLATAWCVLTDYEHIGAFVSSVRSSRLVRQPDGRQFLAQDAVGGVFPFRRTIRVLLELEEFPGDRIEFRDMLGRDFRAYSGTWTVLAEPTGTRVHYALVADPRVALPAMIGRGVMKSNARALLEQVRSEMERRVMLPCLEPGSLAGEARATR